MIVIRFWQWWGCPLPLCSSTRGSVISSRCPDTHGMAWIHLSTITITITHWGAEWKPLVLGTSVFLCIFQRICVLRLRGRECSDIRRSPMGAVVPPHLCICITAPHYFSFPNINICVQISPLPASELLMGLWAPLKCILAALLQDTLLLYLDAPTCISQCVQSCNKLHMFSMDCRSIYLWAVYKVWGIEMYIEDEGARKFVNGHHSTHLGKVSTSIFVMKFWEWCLGTLQCSWRNVIIQENIWRWLGAESNLEQPQWRSFRSEISGNSAARPSWINLTNQPNPTPGYCLPSIKLGL